MTEIAEGKLRPSMHISTEAQIVLASIKKNSSGLLEWIDDAFNPSSNGFELMEYDQRLRSKDYTNNEIWTESPCLLIEIGKVSNLNKARRLISRLGTKKRGNRKI